MTQNRFINRRKINARIPKKLTPLPGQLGNGAGQVVTGIANYVYCRVNGQVQIVFNSRVPPDNDLLVDVGYAYDSPGQYQVLGTRSASPGGPGSSMQLGYAKAARYQLFAAGGGQDPLWLDKRQILDLLVWPHDGLTVRIYPGIVPLGDSYGYIPLTTKDLTAHLPADEGEAALVLLTVDTDGDIVETKGTEFTLADVTDVDDMPTHIPAYPAGTAYVLGAVRVYHGQTSVVVSRTLTDIIQLGFAVAEGGGSGEGDMLKSVYDTDDDGVVDGADEVDGVAVAGNSKYYGTNASGVPGFFTLPSGGGAESPWTPPLASDFSWVNQGGSVVADDDDDGMYIDNEPETFYNWRCLVKSVPPAPYSVTVGMIVNSLPVNYVAAGLVLRESSSGKLITLGPFHDQVVYIAGFRWSSPTAYSGSYLFSTMGRNFDKIFLRISDDETNRIFAFSNDGRNFIQVYSVSRTNFIDPDQIGVSLLSGQTGYKVGLKIFHWAQT
jgi:hypothetical protein